MCTRLLGAFAPFAVRQRDLSRDGSLSQRGYGEKKKKESSGYSGVQRTPHRPPPVYDPPVAGGLGAGGFDAGG